LATPGNENTHLQCYSGFNNLRVFTEEPTAAAKEEVINDPASANSEEFYNLHEDHPADTRNPIGDMAPAVPSGQLREELD
jgi:hypothetical protein